MAGRGTGGAEPVGIYAESSLPSHSLQKGNDSLGEPVLASWNSPKFRYTFFFPFCTLRDSYNQGRSASFFCCTRPRYIQKPAPCNRSARKGARRGFGNFYRRKKPGSLRPNGEKRRQIAGGGTSCRSSPRSRRGRAWQSPFCNGRR